MYTENKRHGFKASASTATIADYAAGKHARWEVELHRFEARFRRIDFPIDRRERNNFIDNWLRTHSETDAETIVACEVCQDEIAEMLLKGQDPHKCPPAIKEKLRQYAVGKSRSSYDVISELRKTK